MADKNKLHDGIFWPIIVLLAIGLITFILVGCTDDCSCKYPTLEDYETFHYVSYEKFFIPETTLPDGTKIGSTHLEVYKFVYRGQHYIQFGRREQRSIILDPEYTKPEVSITAKPGATNDDYESIFGKKMF